MNRPIKFRAWCDAKKQWADEVDVFDDGSYLMRFPNEENAERTRLPQPEDTLVQFTGLHDKEGKEIWEGDILSVNLNRRFETPQVGVVEFGTYQDSEAYTTIEHIGYFIKFKPFEGCDINCTLIDAAKYSHIIGNMFENPELLTEFVVPPPIGYGLEQLPNGQFLMKPKNKDGKKYEVMSPATYQRQLPNSIGHGYFLSERLFSEKPDSILIAEGSFLREHRVIQWPALDGNGNPIQYLVEVTNV